MVRITNSKIEGLVPGSAASDGVNFSQLDTRLQAAKFRDNLSELGIKAIDAAETISRLKMEQMERKLTSIEQVEIVERATNIVAPGYLEAADWLGVDLASGRPLIN